MQDELARIREPLTAPVVDKANVENILEKVELNAFCISKGISEDHHGSLSYDEKSPHTRFVLKLPIHQLFKKAA